VLAFKDGTATGSTRPPAFGLAASSIDVSENERFLRGEVEPLAARQRVQFTS
jgi:hypothetical protein